MASKKNGLGKGFDSLFMDNSSEFLAESGSVMLNVNDIEPDKNQPRTNFDEQSLAELESSIREYGVLQPLLVRPMSNGSYQIVAGERRYRAARQAGLSEIPVIIRSLTEQEAAAIALIENLQREDLNPIEESKGIKRLMDEFGYTQEEAAEKIAKSRPAIANALRLLSLPEEVMQMVEDGYLSAGHARTLLGLNNKYILADVAKQVIAENLSVRQTEKLVKVLNTPERAARTSKPRDKFFDETELALAGVLGRKVNVINRGKGGKIEIEFFDRDDLKKIANIFNED